jgi:hypothetical protein
MNKRIRNKKAKQRVKAQVERDFVGADRHMRRLVFELQWRIYKGHEMMWRNYFRHMSPRFPLLSMPFARAGAPVTEPLRWEEE